MAKDDIDLANEKALLGLLIESRYAESADLDRALWRIVTEEQGLRCEHFRSPTHFEVFSAMMTGRSFFEEIDVASFRAAAPAFDDEEHAENIARSLAQKIMTEASKRNAAKAKPAAPASDRQTRQGNSARRPSTEAREPEGQNHGAKRITWFFKHVLLARDLSPFEVRVAGALVGFVNRKSGATFVSQRKLAGLLGASLRQVQRALDALVAKGYLAKNEQHGPGRSNLYRLTLPAKAPAEATADEDEPKPVAESAPSEMDDSYKDLPGGDDEIPF